MCTYTVYVYYTIYVYTQDMNLYTVYVFIEHLLCHANSGSNALKQDAERKWLERQDIDTDTELWTVGCPHSLAHTYSIPIIGANSQDYV